MQRDPPLERRRQVTSIPGQAAQDVPFSQDFTFQAMDIAFPA
jgi:hypothetical protein